jgi:gliding motility-associated-like protein
MGKQQKKSFWIWSLICCLSSQLAAQCPANIGFEKGSLAGWQCHIGFVSKTGVITLQPSDPVEGQHSILSRSERNGLDPVGRFPVNPPNGSAYSIVLGDFAGGSMVAQVTYTFTIPTNQDAYSIVYHYAVVLDNPEHSPEQQPKFTAKVFNVSRNSYIDCSSFDYTASSTLPGFQSRGSDVFKPWSAVTINLNQHAGETIRLEFTTIDCTVGGHGGYAYIDVDQNCSSPVKGNVLCLGDTAMRLAGLYGFRDYRWYDANFAQLLSTKDTLVFPTLPPPGTKVALEVTPYPGFGCTDTLYTTIQYAAADVEVIMQAADTACAETGIDLTDTSLIIRSSPNLDFYYYRDPEMKNPVAASRIAEGGLYYVKGIDKDGCIGSDTIQLVTIASPSLPVVNNPPELTRPATFDLTELVHPQTGISYSYWKDAAASISLPSPKTIDSSGLYYVKAINEAGCSTLASVQVVIKDLPPLSSLLLPNAFSPNGDGINDLWELPALKNYPDCVLEIFDRDGRKLFSSPGYKQPWDGQYAGKPVPIGTYYYLIKLNNGSQAPAGGSVTVIR